MIRGSAGTLEALEKIIVKAAEAGDASAMQAGLKEFIQLAKIRELDTVKGGNYDPRQRRNPGAPPTSEIESQMGPASYALYAPLKPGAPGAVSRAAPAKMSLGRRDVLGAGAALA